MDAARARIRRLLEAGKRIARPEDELGREARRRLAGSSGLSPQGIDLAFSHALASEHDPAAADLESLMTRAPRGKAAHVLLSAAVFTAAHRAIAFALATSSRVSVRASRRDPVLAALLSEGAPGLFEVVSDLAPEPEDHVFAYGGAATLEALRRTLPIGSTLHAHGPGFGVVIVDAALPREHKGRAAAAIALDTAVFDQRGCLSPRAILLEGGWQAAALFAEELRAAMDLVEQRVPLGHLSAGERAEIIRYRDISAYAGSVLAAGSGFIALTDSRQFSIAPVGRNLQLISTDDGAKLLAEHATSITTYAVAGDDELRSRVRRVLPRAREAKIGRMQAPPLDGPVDLRTLGREERL